MREHTTHFDDCGCYTVALRGELKLVRDAALKAYIPCTCLDCDAFGCDRCVSCCRHELPTVELVAAALKAVSALPPPQEDEG